MSKEQKQEYDKKHYQNNKEAIKERRKQAKEADPERSKQWVRTSNYTNIEKINTNNTERRQRLRDIIQQQKVGKVCKRCGVGDFRVLDFHHVDRNEKEGNIGHLVSLNWSKEHILQEIAKCEILCSNCHRILHWEERNSG